MSEAHFVKAPEGSGAGMWVVTGSVWRGQESVATWSIWALVGARPLVTITAGSLDRGEIDALHAAIVEEWALLDMPCACGQPLSLHADASPHASLTESSECRSFTAATP